MFDDENDTADDGIMYGDQHNQPLIPQIQPRHGKTPKRVVLVKVGSPFFKP